MRKTNWFALIVVGACRLESAPDQAAGASTHPTVGQSTTPTSSSTSWSSATSTSSDTQPPADTAALTETTSEPLECTDPRVPIEVHPGVGSYDCYFAGEATEAAVDHTRGIPRLPVCLFAINVEEIVWVTPKLTLIETGEQIAGGEPTDRVGVLIRAYDEAECSGVTGSFNAIIDDLWFSFPGLEEVCTWEGKLLRIELVVEDLNGERSGSASFELPIAIYEFGEKVDCTKF